MTISPKILKIFITDIVILAIGIVYIFKGIMRVKIYKLEDTEELGPVAILSEGQHTIGRGFLNCNDKRISRKHALMVVEKEDVVIKSVHVNPCFYKSSTGNSISIIVKDKSVTLNDNDQFALLADNFWFKIKVESDNEVEQENIVEHLENVSKNNEILNYQAPTNKGNYDVPHDLSSKKQQISNIFLEASTSQVNDPQSKEIDCLNVHNKMVEESDNNLCTNIPNKEDIEDNREIEQNVEQSSVKDRNTVQLEDNNEFHVISANEEITDISVDDSGTAVIDQINIDIKKEPPMERIGEFSNMTVQRKVDNDQRAQETPGKFEQSTQTNQNDNGEKDNSGIGNTNVPLLIKRERCWYGQVCYRKNPKHLADFSHPGNADYDSDPDDQRPQCPFGNTCYRVNLDHRRQYKHRGKPAPKPNDSYPSIAGPSAQTPKQTNRRKKKKQQNDDSSEPDIEDDNLTDSETGSSVPLRKKRKAATKQKQLETPEDNYDLEDPFIDDGSSDEFELSDVDVDDDTDWDDSQEVDEESEETRRLVKEAKKFTRTSRKKTK